MHDARLCALEAEVQRYRALFDNNGDAAFSLDLEGRVTAANAAAEAITGRALTELVGVSFTDLVAADDMPDASRAFQAALSGESQELRVAISLGDGSRRTALMRGIPIRVGGEVVGVHGLVRAVTEHDQAERALRESDERFQLVTRATRETIWDTDLVTGLTAWTGAIGPMFGLVGEEFEFDEEWWLAHLHPEDKDRVVAALTELLESGQSMWEAEYRLRRPGGGYTALLERGCVVHSPTGAPLRIVGSMMDVTGRRRREEDLRRARQEAEEASQAKAIFLAKMGHELRTPMNGVLGMVDLLLGSDLAPAQREQAETARRSGERLVEIVNDILDLSKIDADLMTLEVVDFDLCGLVEETASLLAPSARRRGLDLRVDVRPDLARRFSGDAGRISQVLTTLLGNALKFTDEGEVSLTVDGEEAAGEGPVRVRLTVRDSGIGMTEAQLQRLFRPLGRTDDATTPRYGGTGVGLAISRRLVDVLGGRLQASSEHGVGSEFVLELPLAPAPPAPAPSEPPAAADPAPVASRVGRDGARVLLVEDNEVNQQVATLMLRRLGCRVDTAEDGAMALSALEAALEAAPYDLVLMDVQMPVMDGIEATRRVRAHQDLRIREIPIVALTAGAVKGDRKSAFAAGMDDYIAKPVRFEALAEAVGRWAVPVLTTATPAPTAAASDVLDPEVVDTLRTLGHSAPPGFLPRLMTTFADETTRQLAALDDALAAGDANTASRVAHSLKGSSASVGAAALRAGFLEVEQLAKAGDTGAAAERARRLGAELEHAVGALEVALGLDSTDQTPT